MTDKEGEKVDETISAVPGNWEFDDGVTEAFDEHARKSIPMYDEVHRMIVELSEWFVRPGSVIYDIGCSTGTLVMMLNEKHRKKGVKIVGIDVSKHMVDWAKRYEMDNVSFIHQDVMKLPDFENADLITAIYTLQFIPSANRLGLVQRIFNGLSEGGAFIVVDKVLAERPQTTNMWNELYWDFKCRNGLTDSMILSKARSLRGVLVPSTLSENLALLEGAGFAADIFVKWYNFAGILAVKPIGAVEGGGSI